MANERIGNRAQNLTSTGVTPKTKVGTRIIEWNVNAACPDSVDTMP